MTVILNQAAAPPVFQAVADDVSFTEVKQKKKEEAASVAARLKGTQSAAGDVRVRVLNGGAEGGSAGKTVEWLQNEVGVTKSENGANARRSSRRRRWSTPPTRRTRPVGSPP